MAFPNSKTRRGRVIDDGKISPTLDTGCKVGMIQIYDDYNSRMRTDGNTGTITPNCGTTAIRNGQKVVESKRSAPMDDRIVRIRKLTPKECFRLQGWTDDYFEKAQFVNSDSQLYKQAGNGVTVNVIEAIARNFDTNVTECHIR